MLEQTTSAGVELVVVSLCRLNSPVQNLGKVCCRSTSAAQQKQLKLLKWTKKGSSSWGRRDYCIPHGTRNIKKWKKIIWLEEWSSQEVWCSTGRRDVEIRLCLWLKEESKGKCSEVVLQPSALWADAACVFGVFQAQRDGNECSMCDVLHSMQKLSLRSGVCPEDRERSWFRLCDGPKAELGCSCGAGRGDQAPGKRPSSG